MRVQKHHISKHSNEYKIADTICMILNEFRNECVRLINNHYNQYNTYDVAAAPSGTYPNTVTKGSIFILSNLFQIMKDSPYMQRDFLSSKVMKSCMKKIDSDYRSYFKAKKDYLKNRTKYKNASIPKPPTMKSGKCRNQAIFENECVATTLNSGYLTIGGKRFIIDIPNINCLMEYEYDVITNGKVTRKKISEIKEVIIQPSRNGYMILITYEKFDENSKPKLTSNKYLGIDIGVKCLLALTSNHLDWTPTMIKGARVKNIVSDSFKKLKHYRKKLGKKSNKKSKRIDHILYNLYNKKMDYCHKLSRMIVNISLENNFSKIVIGYNKFWKQGRNIGGNTKLFQSIPYDDIIFMIRYKAEEEGIEVVTREESYTSKLSFLDLDSFDYDYSISGSKRSKRSIYESKLYGTIHSDINGSLNILRKELGDNIFDTANIGKYKKSPTNLDIKP